MLNIRNLLPADIESAIALQSRVYPTVAPFRAEQFAHLLEIFPRGQFAAVLEERLVGIAISLVIVWEHYSLHHTWASITNDGNFDTHANIPFVDGTSSGFRFSRVAAWMARAPALKMASAA